jgi:hypothetical protein
VLKTKGLTEILEKETGWASKAAPFGVFLALIALC